MSVRVRFAPSPTGFLHLGGARTALFNFLFAKKHGGDFILRIEDTDVTREVEGAVGEIISSLRWLGLEWTEGPDIGGKYGPYRQSQRSEIYRQKLKELREKNTIYPCFCLPEKKLLTIESKVPTCSCSALSASEVTRLLKTSLYAWRFRVPEGRLRWKDLIKGEIEIDSSCFGDFVVMKSDGKPSFHFAVVVDDALMKITHVIRGEDHLTNTLFHLLLYRALGLPPPAFAHLPLLVERGGSKLSKREKSFSVLQLKEEGFLPEAVINYLVLTGWSSGIEGKEVLSLDEMVNLFSLERVSKAPSVFDISRMRWLNQEHLRLTKARRAWEILKHLDGEEWQEIIKHPRFEDFFEMVKENITTLKDLKNYAQIFLFDKVSFSQEQIDLIKSEQARKTLKELKKLIEKEVDFQEESVERLLEKAKNLAKRLGQPVRFILKILRVVLSASEGGPPLPRILVFYGRERSLNLLRKALKS